MYENNNHFPDRRSNYLDVFPRHEATEETPLNEKEARLKSILETVSAETIIGFCIRRAIDKSTVGNTRKLISELKDHYRDTPEQLLEAIGSEGFQLLALL